MNLRLHILLMAACAFGLAACVYAVPPPQPDPPPDPEASWWENADPRPMFDVGCEWRTTGSRTDAPNWYSTFAWAQYPLDIDKRESRMAPGVLLGYDYGYGSSSPDRPRRWSVAGTWTWESAATFGSLRSARRHDGRFFFLSFYWTGFAGYNHADDTREAVKSDVPSDTDALRLGTQASLCIFFVRADGGLAQEILFAGERNDRTEAWLRTGLEAPFTRLMLGWRTTLIRDYHPHYLTIAFEARW